MATVDDALHEVELGGREIVVAFQGKIYNGPELCAALGSSNAAQTTEASGELLAAVYASGGAAALERVNGRFSFALWDEQDGRLVLGRDHLGIEPLFYHESGGRLLFGTSLRALVATEWVDRTLHEPAVLQYLLFGYNPGEETLIRGVKKLPAAHVLSVRDTERESERYWDPSFTDQMTLSEEEYCGRIFELIEESVRVRLNERAPGVFLSGGTDSSAIVSIVSQLADEQVRTYSFRCPGKQSDESRYARFVAERFDTRHTEITYEATSAEAMSELVARMEEPFSDNGIELATFLLGRSAAGEVDYVFSGEGGDEAFAGHPSYIADRAGAIVNRFPDALVTPLAHVLRRIPDSERKRDLRVKVRRFARGLVFPPDLLSHRWRLYYTTGELRGLCSSEFLASCDLGSRYDAMIDSARGADGADRLSRNLYSDYGTLVDFYLRRLDLLSGFSVESRVPLLDYRFVDFAARIPSALKLTAGADPKHIYRKSLERAVPREILYDREKLGHSVPMKRWLREDDWFGDWIRGVLFDGSLGDTGALDMEAVNGMLTAHAKKREDHSHRLWSLSVLALWLDSLDDDRTAGA